MMVRLEWSSQSVHKKFSGFFTPNELIHAINLVMGDARFDNLHWIINDLSEIDGYQFCKNTFVEYLALLYGAYYSNRNITVIFVIPSVDLAESVKEALLSMPIGYKVQVVFALSEIHECNARVFNDD